jgi:hypothetical protein
MYNPLQFFKPLNARFDLAGQMAGEVAESNRLRDARAKQQAGEQRFLGLQQLGQYQPEELNDPQVQGQMQQAQMDMLGGGDKYLNYQLQQQQMEARKQSSVQEEQDRPRIRKAVDDQAQAKMLANDVVAEYLNLPQEEKNPKKDEYREKYKVQWLAHRKAISDLGNIPSSKGYHVDKLPTWEEQVAKSVAWRSTESLMGAREREALANAGLKEIQQSGALGKQSREIAKHDEYMQSKVEESLRAKLKDEELFKPRVYDKNMFDADVALRAKNPAQLAKILNGLLEKGLSTNESEIQAIVNKDAGALKRFFIKTYGTPDVSLNQMYNDIKEMATYRKTRATEIMGDVSVEEVPKKKQAKVTSWDDLE